VLDQNQPKVNLKNTLFVNNWQSIYKQYRRLCV